ncbi:hypothetical protein BASA81_004208 [Batrachochytrium salamandrivorans]|nr:hypothetical protein BASA81_004208 [Batrachochytrium salamandrivorans]
MEAFEEVDGKHLNPNRPKPGYWHKLALLFRASGILAITLSAWVNLQLCRWIIQPVFGRLRYRMMVDKIQQQWFDVLFFLLKRTKLHVTGDFASLHQLHSKRRTKVLIANHATDVDWIYLWMLAQTSQQSGHVKIILKESIRQVPIFGTMMHLLDFIWIKRNWDEDEESITTKLDLLTSDGEQPLWLFIFPEGMTVNVKSLEKSKSFASSQNRPQLDYTLLPRTKGVEGILNSLRGDYDVYDLTMNFTGYSGEIPTWDMGYERNRDFIIPNVYKLFLGMEVGECHIDIVNLGMIKANEQALEQLLDSRWKRKDQLQHEFVQNQCWESTSKRTHLPTGNVFSVLVTISIQTSIVMSLIRLGWKQVVDKVRF